jgi:hypothetical protein
MNRVTSAWRQLNADGRLAAIASLGLLVTMFLPWYQLTNKTLASRNVSAVGDFSWVEAAVLLVAVAVLVLLFARAEGKAFHLPGGDGTVVMVAGGWAVVLLAWRAFDKPGVEKSVAVGLAWGFVFAFAAAGVLAYAGFRMRAAGRPEPPLPGEREPAAAPSPPSAPAPPTSATEPLPARRPVQPASAAQPPREPDLARDQLAIPVEEPPPADRHADPDLTRAHGSEEPLPREDLTEEMRRRGR